MWFFHYWGALWLCRVSGCFFAGFWLWGRLFQFDCFERHHVWIYPLAFDAFGLGRLEPISRSSMERVANCTSNDINGWKKGMLMVLLPALQNQYQTWVSTFFGQPLKPVYTAGIFDWLCMAGASKQSMSASHLDSTWNIRFRAFASGIGTAMPATLSQWSAAGVIIFHCSGLRTCSRRY